VGQDIKLTASDNFQLGGYRADPAGAPKAAVVVIQEIFGVNDHIRAVCDRLAGEGYVAIAPSIFDRVDPNFQCGYSPDEVAVARKFVANPDWAAILRDTQAAVDAVRDVGPVGIIGFCLGEKDAGIPLTDVETIKAKRPEVEIHVYPGAQHGFHCDERASYDKTSADIAWPRSMAFFAKHLKK
jgi:carboxymethylenebutenolidase